MVMACPVSPIGSALLQRAVDAAGPAVRECLVPVCDLFPRPNHQIYVSLLAQDAIERAGIDLTKPFVVACDKQTGCYRFIQHEDDCK